MSTYPYPTGYPHGMAMGQMSDAAYPVRPGASPYLEAGKFGAVVGLCGAAAANIRALQAERIGTSEALANTLRAGVTAGLATAAASYVASRFSGSLTSLAATVATGTLAMYLLTAEDPSATPSPEAEADAPHPGEQA